MIYDVDALISWCEQSSVNISPPDWKDWTMFCCALKVLNCDVSTFVALSNPDAEAAARQKWKDEKNPGRYVNVESAKVKIVGLAKEAGVDLSQFRYRPNVNAILAYAAGGGYILCNDDAEARKLYAAMRLVDADITLFKKLAGKFFCANTSCSVFKSAEKAVNYIVITAKKAGVDVARFYTEPPSSFPMAVPRPKRNPLPEARKVDLPPVYVEPRDVERGMRYVQESTLYKFICRYFPEDDVRRVMNDYRVGASMAFTEYWPNEIASAFPLINAEGNCVDIHLMAYKPDGHRRKENANWKCSNWFLAKKNLSKRRGTWPLFGEHLTVQRPDAPVAVVESEKTAVIASLAAPEYIWCATMSISNLNAARLAAVKDREIYLFPDANGLENWRQKAEKLVQEGFGKVYLCSRIIEDNKVSDDCDIADIIIKSLS